MVGLTEAQLPARHLQSYFLVFNERALQSGAVTRLFGRVRNWPAKLQVIDVHETRLTGLLEAEGLRTEALFPSLSGDARSSDDTSLRWAELIGQGLPYVKTRVVAAQVGVEKGHRKCHSGADGFDASQARMQPRTTR